MKSHLKAMYDELKYYEKLAVVFLFFEYRQRYGWSFEYYVRLVESNKIGDVLE